jgi:signal transduction histidine kinase
MRRTTLKFRILVALVLIVSVTSFLFAGGVLLIKARLEATIFGEMVAEQMQVLSRQLEDGTYHGDALFKGWTFYFGDAVNALPEAVTALAPGSHHSVVVGDLRYQIEAGAWNGGPAYLLYDVTEWEQQEHDVLLMLLYGLLLVLIVAILMGMSATRAILAPVQKLSQRLTQIEPGQTSLRIADDYAGTEIGQIAASFDKYQERLEKFVERERSFTAAASHELRTPLAVMMGAIDVLGASAQPPASQRALERISRACGEMLAFIEATLLLSREESSPIDQGSPADVRQLVERCLEDQAALIAEHGLEIVRDYDGAPLLLQPASLVQITISNLLRNAIEHTRAGRIEIVLREHLLAIRDTGEGIAPDKLALVFERSYTTKQGGTGLGLNLVRRICDRMHWQITLESVLGEGSVATVRFRD